MPDNIIKQIPEGIRSGCVLWQELDGWAGFVRVPLDGGYIDHYIAAPTQTVIISLASMMRSTKAKMKGE